jgi:hypothetical protein
MSTISDIRRRRPEGSVDLCLAGDLVLQHEALDRQLSEAEADPNEGIEGGARAALVDQILALEEEMRASVVTFRLRALPRGKYRELKNSCPPRIREDGQPDPHDARRGFDIDRMYDRLVPVSIFDPVLSEQELKEILDDLTDGQFVALGDTAYGLNEGVVDVPFSRAASRLTRRTGGE